MTVIIDLHPIFYTDELLTALHSVQQHRLVERSITGAGRPPGMRLSIDDPVRRVKAAFDERWRVKFDPGIAQRGYLAEDLLEVTLFHDLGSSWYAAPYEAQVAIQWGEEHESAFDFVIDNDLVVSCKSSTSAPIHKLKPSTANLEQERRMLVAANRPSGSTWHTYMVHPGTLQASGPFEHKLTEQDVDRICTELQATIAAHKHFAQAENPVELDEWNDPVWWQREHGLESTSGAFVYERLDSSAAVEARHRAFVRARAQLRAAKAEEEAARQVIRAHVEEQLAFNPDAKSLTAYSGDRLAVYSVDKRGALRCTEKPLEDTMGV